MKTFGLAFTLILSIATAAVGASEVNVPAVSRYEAMQSPSGKFIAIAGVGLADVSPSFRMRLRILVVTLAQGANEVQPLWPWVNPEWAVTWTKNDVLVVLGLDSEAAVRQYRHRSYHFDSHGKAVESDATAEEKQLVQAAFEKKYGHAPKA